MQAQPNMQIQFDEKWLKELALEYLEEFYERKLETEWYTRDEIKRKTSIKSDKWIRENIDNHPYVVEHELVVNLSDGERSSVRYKKGIIEFLEKYSVRKS